MTGRSFLIITETLAELKQQKEDLETAKEELLAAEQTKQEQKSKADSLVAAQQEKISAAKSDVADAETEIADTDAEIARQKAYEEELEAQKAKEMLPVRRRLSVRKRNLLTVSSQLLQIIMQIRMGHPPGIVPQEVMLPVAGQ